MKTRSAVRFWQVIFTFCYYFKLLTGLAVLKVNYYILYLTCFAYYTNVCRESAFSLVGHLFSILCIPFLILNVYGY